MINTQNLIDKICCTLTTGGLTAIQCCTAQNALTVLCQPVFSVANIAALPNATTYNGRMVYVVSEAKYYYSTLGVWIDDLSSTLRAVTTDINAWGLGTGGQLGNNTATNRSSPVSVGGFSDWCQVSAGFCHSLAVRTNGTLWGWGCNEVGRLGDNSTTNRSSPVSVVGGFTDWCQVSGADRHSVAVRQNGTAWAWGVNVFGGLGDNTTVSKSSPVSVVGGFTDWCQIATGRYFSIAVRQNGTAWAWGSNGQGQLGISSGYARSSPVSVFGGFTDWCRVTAGDQHSIGLRTNGTIYAWGFNAQGRLGDSTCTAKSSPVLVAGGFTDWCQIEAGYGHSLGVRTNGTAWAWGDNGNGRLGLNDETARNSPVQVCGGFTNWCQVSGGFNHSLGVRQNGTAWAWGANSYGQLGDTTTTSRASPVSVAGGITSWTEVSAGRCFSLGRKTTSVGLT